VKGWWSGWNFEYIKHNASTSAFGRKRPVIFAISVKLERPLLRKADIQIREMKNGELKGRNTPGSGR
jgi:hypothetical protein